MIKNGLSITIDSTELTNKETILTEESYSDVETEDKASTLVNSNFEKDAETTFKPIIVQYTKISSEESVDTEPVSSETIKNIVRRSAKEATSYRANLKVNEKRRFKKKVVSKSEVEANSIKAPSKGTVVIGNTNSVSFLSTKKKSGDGLSGKKKNKKTESMSINTTPYYDPRDLKSMQSYCELMKEKLFTSQMKNYKLSLLLKEKNKNIDQLISQVDILKTLNLGLLNQLTAENSSSKASTTHQQNRKSRAKQKRRRPISSYSKSVRMMLNDKNIEKLSLCEIRNIIKMEDLLKKSFESYKNKISITSMKKPQKANMRQNLSSSNTGLTAYTHYNPKKRKSIKMKDPARETDIRRLFELVKTLKPLPKKAKTKAKSKASGKVFEDIKSSMTRSDVLKDNFLSTYCDDNKSLNIPQLESQQPRNHEFSTLRYITRKISCEKITKNCKGGSKRTRHKSDFIGGMSNKKSIKKLDRY